MQGIAPRSQTFSGAISTDNYGRADTLKRSMNRMSVFVKSGAEGFLIGAVKDHTLNPNLLIHMVVRACGTSVPTCCRLSLVTACNCKGFVPAAPHHWHG